VIDMNIVPRREFCLQKASHGPEKFIRKWGGKEVL
jgi:hypothetical protein